jgi:DNA-binding response OmpR family regulator
MEDISFYNPRADLIEAIRQNMPGTPVILVTPPDSHYAQALKKQETLDSLDNTGDSDYVLLTIPSSANERSLFARIQRRLSHILTRTSSSRGYGSASRNNNEQIRIEDLLIDVPKHEVLKAGERVELTPSEFNLLVEMASRNGAVIDYITLVRQVLGYDTTETEAKELIKRHVYALRRKVEPTPGKPRYILNVRGVGYRMATV